MNNNHEMQHPDSPTWCVHCGTFDCFRDRVTCTAERNRQYDSKLNAPRMLKELFGLEATHE